MYTQNITVNGVMFACVKEPGIFKDVQKQNQRDQCIHIKKRAKTKTQI